MYNGEAQFSTHECPSTLPKFKIYDTDNDEYFSSGAVYDSLKEIQTRLISYHADCYDYDEDEHSKDIYDFTLYELVDYGNWQIHDENDNPVEIYPATSKKSKSKYSIFI